MAARGLFSQWERATLHLRFGSLRRPCAEDLILVRSNWAVAILVSRLIALAERHALWGEDAPPERAHRKHLVADELEEAANLPLRHGAEA